MNGANGVGKTLRGRARAMAIVAGFAVAATGMMCVGGSRVAARENDQNERVPRVGAYLAGRFALHLEDWAAAATYMADALERDPDDINLMRRTFLLELGEGRIERALKLAARIVSREPSSPIALALLLVDDFNQGRHDQVSARLAALPAEGVTRFIQPLLNAWTLIAKEPPSPAVYERAVEFLAPLKTVSGLSALRALHAGAISDLAGDREAAQRWFSEAVSVENPTFRMVEIAGGFFQRSGVPERARSLYEAFQTQNPDTLLIETLVAAQNAGASPPPPVVASARDGVAEALFGLASALHQDGSDDVAIAYDRMALFLRPDFPLAQLMAGDVLVSRNRYDDAVALFREVRATNNSALDWTVRLRIADALSRAERDVEATALLETLARERPGMIDALIRLGDQHRVAKRYDQAVDAYSRALDQVKVVTEHYWPVLYGRAMAYERNGKWEQAEVDLLHALELNPNQPLLLNYLGYSWVDRARNLDKAKLMIERAVAARPRDGYIVDSLGWALYRMGDLPGAVTYLERAVEFRPLDPTINDHLGDAYWKVGRKNEAVFQWQRAHQNAEEVELIESLQAKLRAHGVLFEEKPIGGAGKAAFSTPGVVAPAVQKLEPSRPETP
ncbi:TPR_REGION domain-containing protein [Azospirillaceae bacterium]